MRNFVRFMMAGKDTFLYFGYGSNLLKERIQINSPTAQFKAIGNVQDYRLGFYGSWSRWGGGVATIDPTPGHTLWGVVWQIGMENLDALNKQEGVKDNDQGVYRPVELSVKTSTGETLTCRSYRIIDTSQPNLPSPQYMEVLLGGARQQGLPEEYIRELAEIQTNDYKGPVQIMEDLKKNSKS
ncbi:gamma-glutamylcyclotransferase-like [Branchiostoma floridae]|uniref:gamma-glutamylcyclotransferase n=2 Tax=Branchiostoma floridae TaxID=7739 RepID=A0A9J7L9A5_BRAFL|nr:gamma-glutamylcyclotransferase-like [Branchiostoma floridae]